GQGGRIRWTEQDGRRRHFPNRKLVPLVAFGLSDNDVAVPFGRANAITEPLTVFRECGRADAFPGHDVRQFDRTLLRLSKSVEWRCHQQHKQTGWDGGNRTMSSHSDSFRSADCRLRSSINFRVVAYQLPSATRIISLQASYFLFGIRVRRTL